MGGSRLSVELTCPAKVNLALSIGSPRADGMHPLASWMVAVGFGDSLKIEQTDEPCRFDIVPAPLEMGQPRVIVDWPIEKDLVYRAWLLMRERVGRVLQVRVQLVKRIPAGAGLGGGSSNAAGMLVGLNRLFDLGLGVGELVGLGASLGSDVGFLVGAMLGEPSAVVSGLGERLEPMGLASGVHLVLVFPSLACATGEVYGAFDDLAVRAGAGRCFALAGKPPVAPGGEPEIGRVRELARRELLSGDGLFNDLADAAMVVRPELRGVRDRLRDGLGRPVHVTGSGSTLFVVASDAEACEGLAKRAAGVVGLAVVATGVVAGD